MVVDWVVRRWGRLGIATGVAAVMGVAHHRGNATLVLVLVSALITGGLYAGLGFAALGNLRFASMWRQQMTWDVYRDRVWEPHETDMAAQTEQMRKVEARVANFATAHGLERITLAVTGAGIGGAGAAESARSSRTFGHIELGHFWFFPDGVASLPHVVEHELAHIHRNDSVRHILWNSGTAAGSVGCAGLLPLPYAAVAIAALFALHAAASWWRELACDTIAARQCGRIAAEPAMTHLLNERRALPIRLRYASAVTALRSHPPLLLRHWWIRLAPALPRTDQAAPIASWDIGR
ncbi:hypothetical protein [Streptomyces sp. CB00455]|uniref:hypothetical protein n=1 Tax=Streptomyces sp. CB00455 TaxID=1703927 RepID=UPI000A8DC4D9|nr:hypothetical protein [Streptomyces sp. CB00455]